MNNSFSWSQNRREGGPRSRDNEHLLLGSPPAETFSHATLTVPLPGVKPFKAFPSSDPVASSTGGVCTDLLGHRKNIRIVFGNYLASALILFLKRYYKVHQIFVQQ